MSILEVPPKVVSRLDPREILDNNKVEIVKNRLTD